MSGRRRLVLAAVTLVAAAGLAACHGKSTAAGSASPSMSMPMSSGSGSASAGTSAGTSAGKDMVVVKDFSFEPSDLTVPAGTTVTWKFEDAAQHTVQFSQPHVTSPALSNGQTFSYRFTTPGTYSYICSIHQYMHGTVTVTSR